MPTHFSVKLNIPTNNKYVHLFFIVLGFILKLCLLILINNVNFLDSHHAGL